LANEPNLGDFFVTLASGSGEGSWHEVVVSTEPSWVDRKGTCPNLVRGLGFRVWGLGFRVQGFVGKG